MRDGGVSTTFSGLLSVINAPGRSSLKKPAARLCERARLAAACACAPGRGVGLGLRGGELRRPLAHLHDPASCGGGVGGGGGEGGG